MRDKNLVILDQKTVTQNDLSWEELSSMGILTSYDESTHEEAKERLKEADAVFTSKIAITADIMDAAPNLKYIGVLATGYDNVDLEAARERGIACTNIPAYSGEAVAQHTIGLILEMTNRIGLHSDAVRRGNWAYTRDFSFVIEPIVLLTGKSLGIVGYGDIGRRVAKVAEALGMDVLVYSRDGDRALAADFVTLHMPANEETNGFINRETIGKMKDGACLINTARGALVDEPALVEALDSGKIRMFAADVVGKEPPAKDDPLTSHPKAIITPHNCWCPKEIRQRILDRTVENYKSFLEGGRLNRVD